MAGFSHDLRYSARVLVKDKAFTVTALLTLAVCVAANAVIFCIVNAILLRPLPFPEADRLMLVYNSYPKAGAARSGAGVPDYYDRLQETTAFEELALYNERGMTIGGRGDAERVPGGQLTPSLFRLLRARPWRGRLFTQADAEVGHERQVIISHGLWERLFGARDDAIGQDLRMNGAPYTVVGVLPAGFQFENPAVQVWTPVAFRPEDRSDERRHSNNWQMIGRLQSGASVVLAQGQIDALNRRNLDRFPQLRQLLIDVGFHTVVVPLQQEMTREVADTLYLLWAGALFVLLIGCVNVANLTLARANARIKEIATRHVLGAGFGQLVRQMLTETLMVAALAGVLGILLGYWALTLVERLGLERLPRGGEVHMDPVVILYTLALALSVGCLVGLIPLVRIRRGRLHEAFREEGRTGTSGPASRLVRRALVTLQVAFALLLLVGAALLFASFRRVLAVNPGFVPDRVLTGSVAAPGARYKDDAALRGYVARALERLQALPGVVHAGLTGSIPFGQDFSDSVMFPEGYVARRGEAVITVMRSTITPGYLEAMGVKLLRGRLFTDADDETAPPVIIVDDRLARRFWPGQDPIGKRMFQPESAKNLTATNERTRFLTVVGVVDTVMMQGLVGSTERFGAAYFAYAQAPPRLTTFVMKTTVDPAALSVPFRKVMLGLDSEVPPFDIQTMEQRLDVWLTPRRAAMLLSLVFAGVALFLAGVGLYGVLAYHVSERRREIGIRMALGGDERSVFTLVLREGMAMVAAGAVIGLLAALALGRALESQLYQVRATDPRVLVAVTAVLAAVALIACLIPARRAARVNPVVALSDL